MSRNESRPHCCGRFQFDRQAAHHHLIRFAEQPIGFLHRKSGNLHRLCPSRQLVGSLDRLLDGHGKLRGQAKAQMHCGGKPGIQLSVFGANRCFDGAYHVADHIFRRIVQKCCQLPARGNSRILAAKNLFHQQRMFCHRIGPVALGLTIPPRDKGQPMGNVFDFDVHRRRVEQVQSAAR